MNSDFINQFQNLPCPEDTNASLRWENNQIKCGAKQQSLWGSCWDNVCSLAGYDVTSLIAREEQECQAALQMANQAIMSRTASHAHPPTLLERPQYSSFTRHLKEHEKTLILDNDSQTHLSELKEDVRMLLTPENLEYSFTAPAIFYSKLFELVCSHKLPSAYQVDKLESHLKTTENYKKLTTRQKTGFDSIFKKTREIRNVFHKAKITDRINENTIGKIKDIARKTSPTLMFTKQDYIYIAKALTDDPMITVDTDSDSSISSSPTASTTSSRKRVHDSEPNTEEPSEKKSRLSPIPTKEMKCDAPILNERTSKASDLEPSTSKSITIEQNASEKALCPALPKEDLFYQLISTDEGINKSEDKIIKLLTDALNGYYKNMEVKKNRTKDNKTLFNHSASSYLKEKVKNWAETISKLNPAQQKLAYQIIFNHIQDIFCTTDFRFNIEINFSKEENKQLDAIIKSFNISQNGLRPQRLS